MCRQACAAAATHRGNRRLSLLSHGATRFAPIGDANATTIPAPLPGVIVMMVPQDGRVSTVACGPTRQHQPLPPFVALLSASAPSLDGMFTGADCVRELARAVFVGSVHLRKR